MSKNTILQTERLCLRRLQPTDIPMLVDLWSDPEVTKHLGGPREREKLRTNLEQDAKNPFEYQYDLWPLVEKQSNQVIGHCGILDKKVDGKDEFEINYIIGTSEWGKGYATEIGKAIAKHGFDQMELKRLIALIKPENEASERVALKIGMKFEKEVIRPGGAKRKIFAIEKTT